MGAQADPFRHRKFGAYREESDDLNHARSVQPELAKSEKSAEAEVMDWADDIAYAVHDMEDFYRAGFIPLHLLMHEDEIELSRFIDGTFARWSGGDFRPVRGVVTNEQLATAFVELMRWIRAFYQVTEPYEGTIEHRGTLRSLTSALISRYVLGAVPDFESPFRLREPDSENPRTVAIIPTSEHELVMLKQLTWFYVINRPSLAGQQRGQRQVAKDLFHIFRDATESVVSRDLLPIGARQQLEKSLEIQTDIPPENLRARTAADVVCSLSEQQAIALHRRFTGIDPGSVLEGIGP